jgi:hypothetical protein
VEVTEVAWVPLEELDQPPAYADEHEPLRRAIDDIAEAGS